MHYYQLIKGLAVFLVLGIALYLIASSPTMNPGVEVARYTATLTSQPDDQTALVNRCAHYVSLARYAEAVVDCTRALQLQPNSIAALQNRATAYQRWGQLRESLTDWEQSLALMEPSEFWRSNSLERIAYAREQIRIIRQQLESASN